MAPQPRLFWRSVAVTRPDGTETVWGVMASATRVYPGQYDVDVRVSRHRGTFTFGGIRVINEAPSTPSSRSWRVTSDLDWPLRSITRDDGYDFGSLRSAVEAVMDAAMLVTVMRTFANGARVYCHAKRRIVDAPLPLSPHYVAAPLPGVAPATLARASEEDQR